MENQKIFVLSKIQKIENFYKIFKKMNFNEKICFFDNINEIYFFLNEKFNEENIIFLCEKKCDFYFKIKKNINYDIFFIIQKQSNEIIKINPEIKNNIQVEKGDLLKIIFLSDDYEYKLGDTICSFDNIYCFVDEYEEKFINIDKKILFF